MRERSPMRMAAPDVVLFCVGLLLFSGAGYGLVKYGDFSNTASASGAFNVAWKTVTTNPSLPTTALAPGSTGPVPVQVDVYNITKVTITVKCTDPNPAGGGTSSLKVKAPNGQEQTKTGTCGGADAVVTFTWASIPTATTAAGGDSNAARASLAKQFTNATGRGKYDVTVTLTGAAPATGLGLPVEVSGTLAVAIEHYEPTVSPVVK